MTRKKPPDVPGTLDELQVHLSIDKPSGRRVIYLRDCYYECEAIIREAPWCIDMCDQYIEFEIRGCEVCGEWANRPYESTCALHRDPDQPTEGAR